MTAPRWNLDTLLPGGPAGEAFRQALESVTAEVEGLEGRAAAVRDLADADALSALVRDLIATTDALWQLSSFAGCHAAADTRSTAARLARAATSERFSRVERAWIPVMHALDSAAPGTREAFLARPELADARGLLAFRLAGLALELERPLQELWQQVSREALSGWGQLYDLLSGGLKAELALPGQATQNVGISEVAPYRNHPDEAVRRAAFTAEQAAWRTIEGPCALALTNLTGARQTLLDRTGHDELAPSLQRNRLKRETLEALLGAADDAKTRLVPYLERKAALIGKERLDWWDLLAPLPLGSASVDWREATDLVLASFGTFGAPLEHFAKGALDEAWIEAERRDDKAQGGFCTAFPQSRESRIFLTFGGTLDNTLTLAHELGHAYHNSVLFRAPSSAKRRVTSALAETASTFCEAIVRDHAIATAPSEAVRVAMLDQQLMDAVVFLMNIPARYQFERQLYALRRKGAFDPAALTEAMVEAQRSAYAGAIGAPDPMFWASKLHFYISSFAFYNWPYLFGYLFSGAVYARAKAEGPRFLATYDDLLARTGYQDTETLGREVLGENLSDPGFWARAVDEALQPLDAFLAATADGLPQ